MQRVLITGGAGYIGSILCEHLLAAGHHVTVLDNLRYGPGNLKHLCANPHFEFHMGDARDFRHVVPLLKRADVIIPLAALVGAPACEQERRLAWETNHDAVVALANDSMASQLIIYPNTYSGYGVSSTDAPCTEDAPLIPISTYGKSKCAAEKFLLDAHADHAIVFRLATVFGMSPRMRTDLLVNHFVHKAVTDGYITIYEPHFKRNYVHVRDVAAGFICAIENAEAMMGRAYNLGLDAANLSKMELADAIKAQLPGFHIHYAETGKDPDQRNYVVSNQRLRDAGFEAQRGIEAGIAELIKGYRMLGRGQYANI